MGLEFRTLPAAVLGCCLALTACGPPGGTPAASSAGEGPERSSRAAVPAQEPELPLARAARTLPGPGQAIVEVSERGVTVLADDAPRLAVLQQLKETTGFALGLPRDSALESSRVTLHAVDVTLEEALSHVLEGLPFRLQYGVDADRSGHRVQKVAIEEPVRRKRRPDLDQRRAERRERFASQARQRPSREEIERRTAERAAEAAWQVKDPDPEVRAQGAAGVELDRGGIERLADIASGDPSPAVRAAAVERLGDSDSATAVGQLLVALGDPDSEVVIAALDALEFVGDETVIPELGFLLSHADPEIRVRTIEAIEFLE